MLYSKCFILLDKFNWFFQYQKSYGKKLKWNTNIEVAGFSHFTYQLRCFTIKHFNMAQFWLCLLNIIYSKFLLNKKWISIDQNAAQWP